MELGRRQGRLWATAVLVFVGVVLLVDLTGFGIWDPWELDPADVARDIAEGEPVQLEAPPLGRWLVASGFGVFGVREWAGRLPMAVSGLLVVAVAYWLLARFVGRRAGIYAALVTGTTPLFLLNSRQMLGDAPGFAAEALVGLAAVSAVYLPASEGASERWKRIATGLWLGGLGAGVTLAILARGALLGALPPLLAVTVATGLQRTLTEPRRDPRRAAAGWIVAALTAVLTAGVVAAVAADEASYSHLLGGDPEGGEPPAFGAVLEDVFHAYAPWSALVLLALGRLLWPVATKTPQGDQAQPDEAQLTPAQSEPAAPTGPDEDGPEQDEDPAGEPERDEADRADDEGTPAHASGDVDDRDGKGVGPESETETGANAHEPAVTNEAEEHPGGSAGSDVGAAASIESQLSVHEPPLRLVLVLWAAFGYGALTIYLARYGMAPWGSVVALSAAVALFLRDVERSRGAWWAAGLVTLLFTGLIIRDYALYPESPLASLALADVQVPDVFDPRSQWQTVLGLFGVAALLTLGVAPRPGSRPDFRAPYRWLRAQWGRGISFKIWLVLVGLLLLFLLGFGLFCFALETALGVSTIVIRWAKRLMFLPLALPVMILLAQVLVLGLRHLGRMRMLPLLIAGAIVGAYVSQGFLPALSAHFSPREIYDTYNELSSNDEPLGEYHVGSRAAAYYAQGDIEEIKSERKLMEFFGRKGRQWAVFPADELPSIDRTYRERTGRHLFVPEASSARVVLAADEPLEDRRNGNFLAHSVLDEPPEQIDHEVHAYYEDKVELVGYDLELPQEGYVGAGQSFTVTWYWRCLKDLRGSWQIFLHIDGQGLRLNGDHHPVDGNYPVRLWNEGDVIVDRQTLDVPANYRPGRYIFFIGFFRGGQRLEVKEGPHDDANRVRAGVLPIR